MINRWTPLPDFSPSSSAFLSYKYVDQKTIDYLHTEVPVEFRGTGLALDLAKVSLTGTLSVQLGAIKLNELIQQKSNSNNIYRQIFQKISNFQLIFPPDRLRFCVKQPIENAADLRVSAAQSGHPGREVSADRRLISSLLVKNFC